jgi:hypothetical protein
MRPAGTDTVGTGAGDALTVGTGTVGTGTGDAVTGGRVTVGTGTGDADVLAVGVGVGETVTVGCGGLVTVGVGVGSTVGVAVGVAVTVGAGVAGGVVTVGFGESEGLGATVGVGVGLIEGLRRSGRRTAVAVDALITRLRQTDLVLVFLTPLVFAAIAVRLGELTVRPVASAVPAVASSASAARGATRSVLRPEAGRGPEWRPA